MADGRQPPADEVSILSALLSQAVERRDGTAASHTRIGTAAACGHSTATAATAATSARATYVPPAQFDAAVANYSMQLQAWVNLQVDQRLNQVLSNLVNTEVAVHRNELGIAISMAERLENEMSAVAEAQAKLLAVIQHHDAAISELRLLGKDRGGPDVPSVIDSKFALLRAELSAELSTKVDALRQSYRNFEDIDIARLREAEEVLGKVDSLRSEVQAISSRVDSLQGLHSEVHGIGARFGELQTSMSAAMEELQAQQSQEKLALSQRMIAMVRTELTAAFRTEAAEISAFDQRLRHKIDSLAASHQTRVIEQSLGIAAAPAPASMLGLPTAVQTCKAPFSTPYVVESVALAPQVSAAPVALPVTPGPTL